MSKLPVEQAQIASYDELKIQDLERELVQNKELIEMTKGDEDGEDSACSDSEPSEDNLSEGEMAKLIPIKPTPGQNRKDKKKAAADQPVRKNSAQ